MIKIGVTGQHGFVGYHLSQTIRLLKEEFVLVDFERHYFEDSQLLDAFVAQCDVIVHLAALNRHHDPQAIYEMNVGLIKNLVGALERANSRAHIILASSTQEERDNPYGKSKRDGRLMLSAWANKTGGKLSGLVIPNVFGPFGHPYYNSVVATFCHQLARNENPKIDVDAAIKLIYVGELVNEILRVIRIGDNTHELPVAHSREATVSEILHLLQQFKDIYQDKGEFPALKNDFELQLFNTYRCYMDVAGYFPRKFVQHTDIRGSFVEIARHGIAGQTSFSTTLPGITRGNHFHTRKIERFAVIKGEALIQLRRIGTDEVLNFQLSGQEPAYVDMPIWYTHNVKNIGNEILYTIFWINEQFDSDDPDTWFEDV
jgi:UDP-2-acetamido-2,6-beta-L-arabino-hexul-4-ose reductase